VALQIADALTESDYADGDTIIAQGDEGADMYILVEGAAKALIKGVKGHLNGGAVKMYKPGDYFGELALMTDSKRVRAPDPPLSSSPAGRAAHMAPRGAGCDD
jgi:CRP-like cAMP-binding protein